MECTATTSLSNTEYLQYFRQKVTQQRIPLTGSLELTHRCNLRCVHCYLDHHLHGRVEITTPQWCKLIDDITASGCLFLLLTGGEPLLRHDFADIYTHAKKNGLMVTVFTNGTLIDEQVVELFSQLPPLMVEISLYGATAPTYEKISGVAGSYARCLEGIQRLLDARINVKLKTILMTLNYHEFDDIAAMAKAYGVKFRFDAAISPRLNGEQMPITLRVPPQQVVEKDFADEERAQQWKSLWAKMHSPPPSEAIYTCGAGVSSFHVNPYAALQPCLMVTTLQHDLQAAPFKEGWERMIPKLWDRKPHAAYPCQRCEKIAICDTCPALFGLENGAEDQYSEYICELGHQRFQKIRSVST